MFLLQVKIKFTQRFSIDLPNELGKKIVETGYNNNNCYILSEKEKALPTRLINLLLSRNGQQVYVFRMGNRIWE